jgi:hypothetical protein
MKILCRVALGFRMLFDYLFSLIESLFNEHKLVRRAIVLFAMYEIDYAVRISLPRLNEGNLVASLLGVIGILATALAFYTIERNRDA